VRLAGGGERDFNLVVGADGLHSNVRSLAFAPEDAVERHLGYYVAAFEAEGYAPRDELAYVSLGVAGRQISRFALRDDRTMFLLVFAAERLEGAEPDGVAERKRALARVFDGCGWEWPAIAAVLEAASDVYFDRVSQVILRNWSKGRVALIGDAAACVSLVAGEGTGLGMTEAYVLAGEIARHADHAAAFAAYESRLRRFVDGKQASARSFASSFTPRTAPGVWLRNQAARLMAIPGLPNLLVGAQMRDDIELPDYFA
jgi:2-polyprenyl-6-methoxyphenol hydroxylase-like FAD-dependent oxidoreductase